MDLNKKRTILKVEHLDEVANKPNQTNDAFYHHLTLMQVILEMHLKTCPLCVAEYCFDECRRFTLKRHFKSGRVEKGENLSCAIFPLDLKYILCLWMWQRGRLSSTTGLCTILGRVPAGKEET